MRRLLNTFSFSGSRIARPSPVFTWRSFATVADYADLKYMSQEDCQKELLKIKRKMLGYYNTGKYEDALQVAELFASVTEDVMGKENSVYASCLSNVALMNTRLGNNDAAMDKYIAALHIYDEVSGKKSVSYASTLTNLGVLYRNMADMSKGEDKMQLLERSEEALSDSTETRTELLGPNHKETLYCSIHLAGTKRVAGKFTDSERILKKVLGVASSTYGEDDFIVASIHNNLGLTRKCMQLYDEAIKSYETALEIYRESVGDGHPEAITTRHNLAEVYVKMGDEAKAVEIQDYIMDLLDVNKEEAEREVEEGVRRAEEKFKRENPDYVPTSSDGVEVTTTPAVSCTNEDTEGKNLSDIDAVKQHNAHLESPEFQEKVNYDDIEPLSGEDLGFPKVEAVHHQPNTTPSTRRTRGVDKLTTEEKDAAIPAVIVDENNPFADDPVDKKKKFKY